jgi:hypothetical protein
MITDETADEIAQHFQDKFTTAEAATRGLLNTLGYDKDTAVGFAGHFMEEMEGTFSLAGVIQAVYDYGRLKGMAQ